MATTTSNNELTASTLRLYRPPFRYERGYIFDANNEMVADSEGQDVALRIRGWGRIGYMANAEALQDRVGELIAQAITEFWEREWANVLANPAAWDITPDDIDGLLKLAKQGDR